MAETIDSLFFNWEVNEQEIRETYHPQTDSPFEFNSRMPNYEICARELFQKDDFAISDYIFQMHSILNLYVLKNLDEKIDQRKINRAVFSLANAEYIFLKAVNCTKIIFDSICRFEFAFNEMCSQEGVRFNSESFKNRLDSISLDFLRSMPDVGYNFSIRMSLGKARKAFAKTQLPSAISDWITRRKKIIQKKADQIVDESKYFFSSNLWNIFNAYDKKDYDTSIIERIVKKIAYLLWRRRRAMKILRTMVNGYIPTKENGCCSICFTDDGKYYSLSGVDDYKDQIPKIRGWIKKKDFQKIIDALSPGADFKYAYLTDAVMCYGVGWKKGSNVYLSNPAPLNSVHNYANLVKRDISCCERKIMAECSNAHNYEFYIRYAPCEWCQPDLLPNNRTISFVVLEKYPEPLVKLKVKQIKKQGPLPWYVFDRA